MSNVCLSRVCQCSLIKLLYLAMSALVRAGTIMEAMGGVLVRRNVPPAVGVGVRRLDGVGVRDDEREAVLSLSWVNEL